jgi:hypothetical protein
MSLTQLAPPYPIFTDKNGDPLDAGYLYLGEANQNPETNPVQVYWDAALTQPAAQPLRTSNGYVVRNGSPALVYSKFQFSVTVRDKNNQFVIYSPVGFGVVPGISGGDSPRLSVKDFGAVGDGATDDTAALQYALNIAAGKSLYFPQGIYLISDTIYVPPATTIYGEGPGDNWGLTSSEQGSRIKTSGAGTARIWTDVGLPSTPAGTLVDAPIAVAVVLNGSAITVKDIALEGGSDSGGSDAWGAGFFMPSVKRITLENVETEGKFSISGCYIDCTWSNLNTALLDLHTNTYGVTVNADSGSNEILFQDCYLRGGNWGIYLKGTDRTDTSPDIWAWAGASDIVGVSSRIGNDALGTDPNRPENSGCYYRDLQNNFQNRFWYGCSFRSGTAYSIFLDRGRRENFIGCYGEARPDTVETQGVAYTVDALGVEQIVVGDLVFRKVYLTETSRIDVLATNTRAGTVVTSGALSMEVEAYGYDSSAGRAYFTTLDSDADSLVSGNVVTQAAGQITSNQFYATERATATLSMGALAFQQATFENIYFGSDFLSLRDNNFEVHQSRFTNNEAFLSANDEVHINCEDGTQLNFWTNRKGTGSVAQSRIRQTDDDFSSYNDHDLGSTTQPWGDLYTNQIYARLADGVVRPITASSTNLGTGTYPWAIVSTDQVTMGGTGPRILFGSGSPEGAVSAPVGSIYMRSDGGAGTSFYVKESGTGNTGWVAK